MSFTITITEKKTVEKLVGQEWAVIGSKEVERDAQYYERDENQPKTRIENVMGYTPRIQKPVTEEREIFKQTVEELDISDVIAAINNL